MFNGKPICRTDPILVLMSLREKLKSKYEEASQRQTAGGRPSGHMNGLDEAIKEVDNLILEGDFCGVNPIRLSIPEDKQKLGHGVTFQSWFTRVGSDHIRTEVYQFKDGSVVAYQDCVNGVHKPLRMERMFKVLYQSEPAFDTIIKYAGVLDADALELYDMGR